MSELNKNTPESNDEEMKSNTPSKDDALNAPPRKTDGEIEETEKEKKHISAAGIDAITGSATTNVRERHNAGGDAFGATGTNVSYEGATSTAPVGTGLNSGQSGTGARISSTPENDAGGIERKNQDEKKEENEEKDII